MISGWLRVLEGQSPLVIMIILVVAIELLTEVTSNTTLANIMLPIVAEMVNVTHSNGGENDNLAQLSERI